MDTRVRILGVEYTVITDALEEDYPQLKKCDGFTDPSKKLIVVSKFERDEMSIGDLDWYSRKVLRHEILHAHLFESGLAENSKDTWALNEEMIDYFANQLPKIYDVYEVLECQK